MGLLKTDLIILIELLNLSATLGISPALVLVALVSFLAGRATG